MKGSLAQNEKEFLEANIAMALANTAVFRMDAAAALRYYSFIAARGITGGTGNGNYSPDAKLTRGEFLVMMMKAYGMDRDANPTNSCLRQARRPERKCRRCCITCSGNRYYGRLCLLIIISVVFNDFFISYLRMCISSAILGFIFIIDCVFGAVLYAG